MQLPADATLEHAAELAATLPAALAQGEGLFRVDASALQAYDTSTIALLMQARRTAQAAGRGFMVTGAPAQLTQLAALYGVEELLSLSPS
ncbi:MAG: STAS domain-containing protein [Betaproteobacteria bacterium]|nr:STAS domain-containing protein [Betaproteobacteria bacterium]